MGLIGFFFRYARTSPLPLSRDGGVVDPQEFHCRSQSTEEGNVRGRPILPTRLFWHSRQCPPKKREKNPNISIEWRKEQVEKSSGKKNYLCVSEYKKNHPSPFYLYEPYIVARTPHCCSSLSTCHISWRVVKKQPLYEAFIYLTCFFFVIRWGDQDQNILGRSPRMPHMSNARE